MEKYYSSYHLIDKNEIGKEIFLSSEFVFKVFFSNDLNCKIAEYYDDKKNVSWILYYYQTLTEKIKSHYLLNYRHAILSLCDEFPNGIKIDFYQNWKISKCTIDIFYDNGSPKTTQEMDSNCQLVEYRQCIYDGSGTQIAEKIFYPDSWTIHTEKII